MLHEQGTAYRMALFSWLWQKQMALHSHSRSWNKVDSSNFHIFLLVGSHHFSSYMESYSTRVTQDTQAHTFARSIRAFAFKLKILAIHALFLTFICFRVSFTCIIPFLILSLRFPFSLKDLDGKFKLPALTRKSFIKNF